METPQVIKKDVLLRGIYLAEKNKIEVTDDVQLAELAGICPRIVKASEVNRKITTKSDLENADNQKIKVGLGQDSHCFSETKKPLILAGVQISAGNGLEGNSDGDVILHALVNAISSALGAGSISNYADNLCKSGIKDSRVYLGQVLKKMKKNNFIVGNISISIEAAAPKLEKYFSKMKFSLANLLNISNNQIGIPVRSGK